MRVHTTALASRPGLAGAALAGSAAAAVEAGDAAAAVEAGDAAVAVVVRAVSETALYTKGGAVSITLLAIPAVHVQNCMWTH